MKKTVLFAALLCLAQSSLHAQSVATNMNYQGKVTDSTGTGIGTGTPVNRKIRFRVYDAASAGNLLWGEQQTVTIANGEFSVLLGTGDVYTLSSVSDSHGTLDTVINTNSTYSSPSNDRYMEITVDEGGGTIDASDTPISPRQQITSTAFAFRAKTAESVGANNSLQLGTATSSGLGFYNASRLFNSYTIDGPVLYGNSGGALGSYSGGSTQKATLLWNSAGQVGVGTPVLSTSNTNTTNKLVLQGDDATTPAQQLVIRGNADPAVRLNIGVDTTLNQGTLQSYTAAASYGNLILNPLGGNVGIGTSTPGVPLTFSNSMGDKISLWGQSALGCGIGIQGGQLQIHGGNVNDDVVFGYGSSVSMTETMRIKGNGNVGIGTSSPGTKLDVNGNVNVSGTIFITDGSSAIYGKNTSGVAEAAFYPRSNNGTYLNYGTSGLFIRNNASTIKLFMTDAGNVGIGTTTPAAKLDVNGNVNVSGNISATGTVQAGNFLLANNNGVSGFPSNPTFQVCTNYPNSSPTSLVSAWGNSDNSGVLVGTTMDSGIAFQVGSSIGLTNGVASGYGTNRFMVLGNGNVGIGTTAPVVPLDVQSYQNLTMVDNGIMGNATTVSGTAYTLTNASSTGRGIEVYSMDGAGSWAINYSVAGRVGIRSAYAISTGTQFLCYSDRRIKRDLQPTSTSNDLALINQLQPTDYRMVDPDAGRELKKGFIAQEVEKVIPQAVTRSTEFVPEIMSLATASHFDAADKTLALTLPKDHALKVGDKVRMHLDGRRLDLVVGAVPSARELVMKNCDKEPKQVLVYGKQVNDFRTVDYDRIFTTGIGAIQELDRQLKEKDAKIAALEARLAAIEKLLNKPVGH